MSSRPRIKGKIPRNKRVSEYPLLEVFGFPPDTISIEGQDTQANRICPFVGNICEKFRQYEYGYCSVVYAAEADEGKQMPYAVCDHRLDGDPIDAVLFDYFRGATSKLVSEVVMRNPRISFDFVAVSEEDDKRTRAIAIETQAIDLRGGGVRPAFEAWQEGRVSDWRAYYTKDAQNRGREDKVAYGVNMGNIYKRLGLQTAEKGTFLKSIGIPLYVVMQDRPFQYLHKRIRFAEVATDWDITFMTFDYTGRTTTNGQLEFTQQRVVRTSLESFVAALAANNRVGDDLKTVFLNAVQKKAAAQLRR